MLGHYLILSAILFSIGLFGALSRRNGVVILMSIELMLNAANLALVSFPNTLFPACFRAGVCSFYPCRCRRRGDGGPGYRHGDLPEPPNNRCHQRRFDEMVGGC